MKKKYVTVTDANNAKSKAEIPDTSLVIVYDENENENKYFELPSSVTYKNEESIFVKIVNVYVIFGKSSYINGIRTYYSAVYKEI